MKLTKANVQDIFGLSIAQQGMLFHYLANTEVNLYNIQLVLNINGAVKEGLLREAFEKVRAKNEVMRSVFQWEKVSSPVQIVLKQSDLDFYYAELSDKQADVAARYVNDLIQSDRNSRFDLGAVPFRVHLIKMSAVNYYLIITHHHILYDGWSTGILLRELFSTYRQINLGNEDVRHPKTAYREVLLQMSKRSDGEAAKQYWSDYLKGYAVRPLLNLPEENPSPGNKLKEIHLVLGRERVDRYAISNKVTPSAILYAAYGILLQKYSDSDDIVFGIPVADRLPNIPGIEDVMGMFINTIPFRLRTSGAKNAADIIREVNLQLIANNQYSGISYNEIKGLMDLRPKDELFQSILGIENYPIDLAEIQCNDDFTIQLHSTYGDTGLPIVIMVFFRTEIEVLITYQADLVPESYINRFGERFRIIIEAIVDHPQQAIREINCLLPEERHRLLTVFNDTRDMGDTKDTVLQLFRHQVALSPDAIAIQYEGQLLTYLELDELSNQVAHCLITRYRLRQSDLAAVMMDRSDWLVVAILGILKTGAAYIPIDPEYPAGRKNGMIADAKPQVLVLEMYYYSDVETGTIPVFAIDVEFERGEFPATPPDVALTEKDLAYIIYTSGSTGNPKGVMIAHGSLVNYITWAVGQYVKAGNSNFPLYTSISFDLTITSIFGPLVSGGRIIVYKGEERTGLLEKAFTEPDSEIIKLTPSHLKIIREAGYLLKMAPGKKKILIVGGEKLDTILAGSIHRQYMGMLEIYNEYGPTEATVGCMIYRFNPGDDTLSVPIGRPISNMRIYLLDRYLQPALPEATGEIYIGGRGVAKGYLNNGSLTAEKFKKDFFCDDEGCRLYKTGDMARWLPDLTIEYIGRTDKQVKVKGHRIELGEIEDLLRAHPHVEDAVVALKDKDDPDKGLLAYYVPGHGQLLKMIKSEDQQHSGTGKMQLHKLPNGLKMHAYNKTELEFIYDEIFVNNVYLKYGMQFREGACVVDIGANAGMFSILANLAAKNVTIYSFEPLPPTFRLLEANAGLYKGNFNLFNYGVGDKEEDKTFFFYPNATVLSTSSTDWTGVKNIVKQFIVNSAGPGVDHLPEEKLDELLKERLVFEEYTCPIKTVSGIIEENGIAQIDYLKIDVEEAEWAVLSGIKEKDWEKIMQVVIEVHDDSQGRLQMIAGLLGTHGFRVHINQSEDAKSTNLYDLYASRLPEVADSSVPASQLNLATFVDPDDASREIRRFLEDRLPEFMVPSSLVPLDELPLTINGKIDYAALPDPDRRSSGVAYEAAQTAEEKKLVQIWKEILGIDRVGINDDFFTLGGESLSATRLANKLKNEFTVDVSINAIFEHATIKRLAGYLDPIKGGSLSRITKAKNKPEHLPLSFSQERLWFIDQLEGSVQYHVRAVLRLRGRLDRSGLEYAFGQIVNRHEVLRTVIGQQEGQPYQRVLPVNGWRIGIIDGPVSIEKLVSRPFDLSADHPLRCDLIALGEEEHLLVVTLHHIASDGWSTSIIVGELAELYDAYVNGRSSRLKPLAVQYADYAIWQRGYLTGGVLEKKLSYWKEQLAGVVPLNLPTDHVRPAVQSTKGASLSHTLDRELSVQLQQLAQEQGVTLYMLLLAVFKVLLYRYSGQEDICVGSPVAGRQQQEVEGLIGFFINTLALRSEVKGDRSLQELLEAVRETTLGAYGNQDAPFEKVAEAVVRERDMSRSPLFQVMFVLQNTPQLPELELAGVVVSEERIEQRTAQFDLTMSIQETQEGLGMGVAYCTDLFEERTIHRMIGHYERLLQAAVRDIHVRVGELSMLSEEEERQLVEEFGEGPRVAYPRDRTIVELFEEQVRRTPEKEAVICGEQRLSYRELDRRSNQVGHYCRARGVREETLVPVCMERSMEMIITILGILKAGGAYVPIDPAYPAERIAYMVKDTGSEVMELDWERIDQEPVSGVERSLRPDQLAYVMYTSGTTGKPKGVMITHGNVVSLVKEDGYVSFREEDILLSTGSPSFDVSTMEYWGMLLNGGQLIMISEERLLDHELLKGEIRGRGVDRMWFTSSWFNQLVDTDLGVFEGLSTVLVGGEKLSAVHIKKLMGRYPAMEVINGYGPTENTTFSLTYKIRGQEEGVSVPIGRPLHNRRAYVLNKGGGLCPMGAAGEIYVGGVGLSRGYWGLPELTQERFVSNPWRVGERMYRTGDMGRWLADGTIDYLGRKDDQIKIRGYRVELGEIESVLQQSDGVRQAVVTAPEGSGGSKRLVGYVVSEGTFDRERLLDHLRSRLPEYMVPSLLVELEELPLTANGKVDRRALPDPGRSEGERREYMAPRSTVEKVLTGIWEELLGVERVGIYDNFFDLGGHSLLAMRVVAAIRTALKVELSVRDLFTHGTLNELGRYLQGRELGSLLPAIAVGERPERIPLSFSQERLWFIDQLEGSVQYHVPAVLRLRGKLDREALEYAFGQIVNRHEVLRTVIGQQEGRPYQRVLPPDEWRMGIIDGPDSIEQLISRPFDLTVNHPLRCDLIVLGEEEHLLVVTLHHIASDGWSTAIIVRELAELYDAYVNGRSSRLKVLPVQYADYAIWQRGYLSGEVLEKKLSYWKEQLAGVIPLNLPTDRVRPAVQSTRGASLSCALDRELSEQLRKLAQEQGVTLYMLLLSIFQVLLHRYSGQEDICVGSPVAGRQQQEVEGLIGFFVNTVALRSRVKGDRALRELLEAVRETTLGAYGNQDAPFEKVVESVVRERDMSRSPLFQIMFVLQNTPELPELELGKVVLSEEKMEHRTAQFDLTFFIQDGPGGLWIRADYCTDLFEEDTIHRMMGHYKRLLQEAVRDIEVRVNELRMVSEEEARELVEQFGEGPQVAYPRDRTIVELFEEQAKRTPENIAVVFGEKQLRYQELDERSNQVGHYLREQGVREEVLVPVCMERSIEMIVAILGILKAGGAYVPIDPAYPAERIRYMVEDTGSEVRELDWERIDRNPVSRVERSLRPDHLAYVIYTSGSTGRPKGVMIEHAGVVNRLLWGQDQFKLSVEDVVLQKTNYCFDVSVWELFWPLLVGSKLVFLQPGDQKDNEQLRAVIDREQVTVLHFVPSMLAVFLPDIQKGDHASIRKILCSGEALKPGEVAMCREKFPRAQVYNLYGPTEATVEAACYAVEGKEAEGWVIPIGRPVSNTRMYILTNENTLAPVGVPGELCIGGVQVARGYWRQPERTLERFVVDPFRVGEKMYKTGDLCRWLADGNIEYLGRKDDQVKIRGYRIELSEIECVLQQSGQVRQAVVAAREMADSSKRLVGYVVAEGVFDREALLGQLRSRLPEYMVPSVLVELEELPLTASGKVDRRALPDPGVSVDREYVAPRSKVEEVLAGIWGELLGMERIGIHDNFFELGGDSIITMQVVSLARRAGYALRPKNLFMHQTVASLSAAIESRTVQGASITGEQGILSGTSGLLPIQRWYFSLDQREFDHFNQSVLLGIDKRIGMDLLGAVVSELLGRHDSLRFRYEQVGEEWWQHYGEMRDVVEEEDLRAVAAGELKGRIEELADRWQRSLSIKRGELVRVVLLRLPEGEVRNRLLVIVHHLAVDGVSWRILLAELELLLVGRLEGREVNLGRKGSSYREWYGTLEEYGRSERLLGQRDYWRGVEKSYRPLPVDRDYKEAVKEGERGHQVSRLGVESTRRLLQEVPRVYHTEINDVLLTALSVLLTSWSGESKVVIGLEGHGREVLDPQTDTSRTVGWFTSLYPVLLEPGEGKGAGEQLRRVKEQLRGIPDRGIGYGVLRYINGELEGRQPWDIVFNYLGQLDNVVKEGGVLVGAEESSGRVIGAEYVMAEPLSVNGMVSGGELICRWSYSGRHYEAETVRRLSERYMGILAELIDHCAEQEKKGEVYTPSDFGLGGAVSDEELDELIEEAGKLSCGAGGISGLYRMTGLQEGMLFHGLYEGIGGSYIDQLVCGLGGIRKDWFGEVWGWLLRRHSALRSGFYYDIMRLPVQCVYREVKLGVDEIDCRGMGAEEREEYVQEYGRRDRERGFDFREAPLMRVALLRMGEQEYRMVWTWHHILFDGWSMEVLMKEFLDGYELLSGGGKLDETREDRYEEYIRYVGGRSKTEERAYWEEYMRGIEGGTLLPFIGGTMLRTKGGGRYGEERLRIGGREAARLMRYASRHRITINTVMQGVWSYLLHRYSGKEDVVYGVIVSGRPEGLEGVEGRVGMYINTLPLHGKVREGVEVSAWLRGLQEEQVRSREYQYTSLSEIQRWTEKSGDLFDSLLVFENYPVSAVITSKLWKLEVSQVQVKERTNYPLTIGIDAREEINVLFSYNKDLLEEEYVRAIAGHFEHVLEQMTAEGEKELGAIELITEVERVRLLAEFADGPLVVYPGGRTVVDMFEGQANRTPELVAVVFGENRLSYREINERSNQLGDYLRKQYGIQPDDLIGILLERSERMIISILGVLKSGGAYVPIDPAYPADRIGFMINDSKCKVLIDEEELSRFELCRESYSIEDRPPVSKPADLAYVIYTSGTTGNPKGVMIGHGSLYDRIEYLKNNYSLTPEDNMIFYRSYSFDGAIEEYLLPLMIGATCFIAPADFKQDIVNNIINCVDRHKITKINMPPVLLGELVEFTDEEALTKLSTLRHVVSGGGPLSVKIINGFLAKFSAALHNSYGPTENTIDSTNWRAEIRQSSLCVPIGRPVQHSQAYVLDHKLRLVPPGAWGELHVSGVGLSRGYLNQPGLTAEKFIDHPFRDGEKMYKTGDLCRWLADGNIEYRGRTDDQVKIRGYRVELGEIESVLQQSDGVRQAVVVACETSGGDMRLVGYVVADGGLDREVILGQLRSRLPEYMVPSILVELSEVPLTTNGKVDRRALPDPREWAGREYVAPRNAVEVTLADIWKELLGVERVGIYDNFFERGGHSLLVMRVVAAIRKVLNLEVSVRDLFTHTTISELGRYLQGREQGSLLPAIVAGERPEQIPLSFSQERLWFIDQLEGTVHYHIPAVLRLRGRLHRSALEYAFRQIVNRHEVLRTVIGLQEGRPYQRVLPLDEWRMGVIDRAEASEAAIGELISRRFDLSGDHPLRCDLIVLEEEEHLLAVTLHHIASDGWSTSIIFGELAELYDAYVKGRSSLLKPLPVQYADYAIWQRQYMQGKVLEKKLSYWKEQLTGVAPLNLPTDHVRPAVQSTRGASLSYALDLELLEQLRTLAREQGATLYMLLLSVFQVLLYRYSGQEDICVGSPVAGRQQQEVEGLIGFFLNMLALRSQVRGDLPLRELVEQVRELLMEAYANQDAPFERVVEAVVRERDMSRSPLFQVMFVLQNTPELPELKLGELVLSEERIAQRTAQFDVTMWIREQADGLNIAVDYCTDLFEEDTIRRMMGHYERLLREAARDIEMRVSELRMLSGEEERQQLEEFGQGPRIAYPRDRTIVELLAEQAKRTPEKEAVRCGEQRLSYRELEERSSQLGHYLRRMGVREETLVPVCLERSIGMIVAILGILKAGGAYVPIDVNHPRERNGYILEDIGLGLLIVEDRTVDRLDTSGWEVINLDRIECESGEQGAWRPRGDDLAYVLYTSGTTGRPKGVMIRHSSLYNFILGMTTLLQAGEEMVMLSVTTYSFDISGLEFYLPLSVGGRLEVASESTLQDVERLRAEIAASGATHMQATPSRWQLLWESGWRNETGVVVLSGGEAISNRLKELLTGVSGEGIWNLYGPTETTIWSAACRLKSGDGITIGRPIANTGVYILDKAMRLMPVGGYGDLYISGAGLSTGYYRREELTGEKFVPNPYARAGHETLYKTGDLARWRPDGRLEFAGRQDYQVKIRGYRIELEEIENTLRAYKNIDQAVVAAQQGKEEEKYLVAYMVAGTVLDRTAVRSYVAEKLPSYMVPDYFVQLEAFPLTPNGKVDRKSLPLTAPGHQEEIQGPANVQEERLLTIWSELLTIDCQKIGVLNDFFTIGGNSIKAFHLDYQIHRCFGKKLGLRAVFEHRTIRKMAMLLRGADETRPEYIPEAPKRKYYPASSAQERIYYEWLQRKDSLAYNISGAWYIEKDSLETTLGDYLRVLVDRHPALRTSFTLTDAGVVQEVHSGGRIDLAVISAHEEDDLEAVFSDFVQPFDLSSPALIRFALVKQGGNKGCLLVDVHHIVCDGISLNILMEDFKYAIQGMTPKPLERSFVDYACWQRSAHPRLLEQRAFWQNVLADPPPVPDLAEETIDNDEDITKADVIQLVIQGPLYEKIKTFVSVEEASGFTLLLSVYYLLIYKISGNTDIIIGSDAIGRTQPAVRQIVGTFVNILPLRVRIDTDEDFRTFLRTVRETVLLAYENQEFPFDEMGVADVVPVHFSFMNYFDREASFRLNGLTFRPANLQKERTTQYGFKVQVLETGDGYIVEFVYSKARFKRETIELFTQYFENILTMAMEQPSVKLGDINS